MSSTVEQIKRRLSIMDVVGSYIKLDKAGKNYKAKSPFTSEKTPSFFVSPDRDMYYCFSSGKGGDIFTFVQEMEGLDFKGALRVLADRAGVTLTAYRKDDSDERDRLFSLLERTTLLYEAWLTKHKEAQMYLKERGFSKDTIAHWRLGYAPAKWKSTLTALLADGYTEKEIEKAGIVKPSDRDDGSKLKSAHHDKYYDRFRGRIMFPIADSSGRVIAFSGRILPSKENPEYNEEIAKYINSPDTPLFNKSQALYGYDKAKYAIRKFHFSIIVEGQMDLLLSHQAGYPNSVAVLGSAVTRDQLTLLNRLAENVVLAFDADRAGVASAGKTAELGLSLGMNVKAAVLPPGVDPADLAKEGAEKWKKVVRASKHIIDFYLEHLKRNTKDERAYRLEVSRVVLPHLSLIANNIDKAHFVSRVAEALGISEEPVWDELKRIKMPVVPEVSQPEVVKANEQARFKNLTEERLVGVLLWQKGNKLEDIDYERVENTFKDIVGSEHYSALMKQGKKMLDQMVFEIENLYGDTSTTLLRTDVEDILVNLKRGHLVKNRNAVLAALKTAEEAHEAALTAEG